jgi:hypothetical protein
MPPLSRGSRAVGHRPAGLAGRQLHEVDAGKRTAQLLHRPAAVKAAEVDRDEPTAVRKAFR